MSSSGSSRLPGYGAALVLLAVLVSLMTWWVTAPPELPQVKLPAPAQPMRPVVQTPPAAPAPTIRTTPPPDPRAIDPDIQRLADDLAGKKESPMRDLEIVKEFIGLYSKAFQGNPIGLNEDITAVLTGQNYRKGILFPPNSPMIVNGQIVDRWGTPYWFHSTSGTQMEIRSAGPDKSLFTPDDIVINPGPDNMGIGVARVQ